MFLYVCRLSGAVDERLSAGSVSMPATMAIETAALVVPVTALEFLREECLLTGRGSLASYVVITDMPWLIQRHSLANGKRLRPFFN